MLAYPDPRWTSRERGAPRSPTTTSAVGPSVWTSTTTGGRRSPSPATGDRSRPSPAATGRCCTAPASSSTPARPAPATGWCSTASSTRPTSSSTAPTSETRRATSSPTPTRSPIWPASAPSTSLPWRWPAALRPTGGPSATSPGSSSTGTAWTRRGTPEGLWRGVRIERTGPVRINRLRVLCRDAEPARANVMVRAELDSDDARTVRVRTTLDGIVERELEHPLAKGTNSVEWTFGVDNPKLWWPRALGDQPLGQLEVTVSVDHEPSHARAVRTGLRQVAMHHWTLTVNGERLFLKGANAGPDAHGAGRGDTGRSPPRRRARRRRRPRPAAHPRSHHAPRAVRGRRRARHADLAGPPAAVGIRPLGRQAGGPPGRRGGRPARPPPVGGDLVRSQRAGGDRRAARRADHEPRRHGLRRRPGAAELEPLDPRCPHQAHARTGRRLPPRHRALRGGTPPAAARRHGQPPLLRLVPRARSASSPASPPPGPAWSAS